MSQHSRRRAPSSLKNPGHQAELAGLAILKDDCFPPGNQEKTMASYDRMRIMTLVRRWQMLRALMFWQGSFTFYGGVVFVPPWP
jgi:hypothetical protein